MFHATKIQIFPIQANKEIKNIGNNAKKQNYITLFYAKKPGILQCQAQYIVVNRFSGITSTQRGT